MHDPKYQSMANSRKQKHLMKKIVQFLAVFAMTVAVSLVVYGVVPASFVKVGEAPSPGLRIATVDMQRLFNNYHRTVVEQAELSEEHDRIQKENQERLAGVRAQESELQQLKKEIEASGLAEDAKREQIRQYQLKLEEAKAGVRVRQELVQRREKAYRLQKETTRKVIVEELRMQIEEYARNEGFDLILDKSGSSANNVAVVLYSTEAIDITGVLLPILNKDGPKDSKPADINKP